VSPPTTSDFSGAPLTGSNDATQVRVEFPDGSRRDLTVSASEAARLSGEGQEVPRHWYERARRWIWRNLKKIVVAVVALWFASVVLPAVVQQWADRQKELELKTSLVTNISDAVADATATGRLLKRNLLPEGIVQEAAAFRLERAKAEAVTVDSPGGKTRTDAELAKIEKAQEALNAGTDATDRAWRDLNNRMRNDWIKASASAQARLRTYFGQTGLPDRFSQFRDVVRAQLVLVLSRLTKKNRQDMEGIVLAYICQGDKNEPTPGADGPIVRTCEIRSRGGGPTGKSFNWDAIAIELARRNAASVGEIRDANADGYSTGFCDLADATVPLLPFVLDQARLCG
jgi:hypothetical protein